jgi:hypothetical protein
MLGVGCRDGVPKDLADDGPQAAGGLIVALRLHLAERDQDMGGFDLGDRQVPEIGICDPD